MIAAILLFGGQNQGKPGILFKIRYLGSERCVTHPNSSFRIRGRQWRRSACGIFAANRACEPAIKLSGQPQRGLMRIVERVEQDLVAAMKARQELRLSVLRMMKSALKLKQVELTRPLDDSEATAVLRTLVKQRQDSAEQFRKGRREELAAKEEAEIKIVEEYLPAAASEAEIEAAVTAAIAETGAASAKDLGKVMKAAMARLAGKNVDGKIVNEKARAKLGA